MPEPLKNLYNKAFFDQLENAFTQSFPNYDHAEFLKKIFSKEWKQMELKQRVRHVALVLHGFLPASFPEAVPQLIKAGKILCSNSRKGYGFLCIFFCDYIEVFGLDHFTESMKAIEELTQLASAEFCIRQFILRYPDQTMAQMLRWSQHTSEDVRRLSSEGCRPRLPWGIALASYKQNPAPVLPILENLKNDPSEYVRRSVANNLNDIAKDNPTLVLQLVSKWRNGGPATDWVIKHGCRTLLKKGNEKALGLIGYKISAKIKISKLELASAKVRIGQSLTFSFELALHEKKASVLRLEYAIDYVKSNGKISRKIFKISEGKFEPGKQYVLHRKQRFADLTTRKHYEGKHSIGIIVNGKELSKKDFMVTR